MKKIIEKAEEVEELVQVHFNPLTVSKEVEGIIKKELDINATVYHDFDDVEQFSNYYLVLTGSELEEDEAELIEDFFSARIDSIYEMTLAIIDKLFDGYASTSYVKLIDSRIYDDSPIVVEFTPVNYKEFLKS